MIRALLLSLLASVALLAETGRLRIRTNVPARVSIRDASGAWHWGRDAAGMPFQYDGLPRIWTDGSIEIELPAGPVDVIASRPYSWLPVSTTAAVTQNETTEVTLELERLVDLKSRGWFGGDAHHHVVHGERHNITDLPTVAPIARAEGLDWASFAEVWNGALPDNEQPSREELKRLVEELSDDWLLAAWGREHPKDHLGHMAGFPLREARTYAQAVGRNEYLGTLDPRPSLAHFEILRNFHALGSIAVYTHPTREYGGTEESVGNIARELPFDVVAAPETLDAIDVLTDAPKHQHDLALWHFLLNRGLQLPACGFSDACFDRRGERPGDTRTYVLTDQTPLTINAVIDAIRAGRTFASTGPLVLFSVDDKPVGTSFTAGGERRRGRVRAWNAVDYRDPRAPAMVERIEVIRNGEVWKSFDFEGRQEALVGFEVSAQENAWYSVQVYGSAPHQFATTSPVYFEADDYRRPRGATARILGRVLGDVPGAKAQCYEELKYPAQTQPLASTEVVDGQFELACPATARVRVTADGYAPVVKSVFLDNDAIYRDLFWGIRREKMTDPAFYREIERRLGEVVLEFELEAGR